MYMVPVTAIALNLGVLTGPVLGNRVAELEVSFNGEVAFVLERSDAVH